MANATRTINPQQAGGIESYVFADGEGVGTRALLVNTGGGLRYRILPDRGLDIDHAFFNQHSLTFLTHKGVMKPSRAYDRGLDWLKSFPGGLLTSCGPLNVGPPTTDQGESLGLHGTHSNTPATIESIIQPDPRRGDRSEMSVTAVVRYGQLYGPSVALRRTIQSTLGANAIDVTDEFFNAGNTDAPHAWLLHINFGYPLVDAGAELCFDAKVQPFDNDGARTRFKGGVDAKKIPAPLAAHRGDTSAVAYLFPKADKQGRATVGIVNKKLGVGVAIRYSTREFPRCGNWQHFGPAGEYVTALEPMNGTIDGRDQDRANGLLDTLKSGARKTYRYRIEVVTGRDAIAALRALNAS